MNVQRFPPDDPREWLNRARSNLAKAKAAANVCGVYLEDLCFDAQQAAEKAIKAVLLALGVRFPYTHDLAQLLTLLQERGVALPPMVEQAAILSDYAVAARYPAVAEPVTPEEYQQAVTLADAVLSWAQRMIDDLSGGTPLGVT